MKNLRSDRLLVPLAFATIYIVWGSTYLANWFAIRDFPTFFMCGTRFFVAGSILFLASLLFGAKMPSKEHWKNTAFLGFFFFFLGNGGAVWALNYLDSGITALIVASQPLVTVLMMWVLINHRPTKKTLIGVFIGLIGMVLLVTQNQFTSSNEMMLGIGIVLLCVLGWGYASIKISQIPLPKSKPMAAAMQMLMGGTMLLILSIASGDAFELDLAKITPRGAWSLIYLIVFGAILAFSAFNYLLLKTTPDKVATSTYVNPVIALFLGWSLNNEIISTQSFFAAALLVTGVIFITTGKRQKKKLEIEKLETLENGES